MKYTPFMQGIAGNVVNMGTLKGSVTDRLFANTAQAVTTLLTARFTVCWVRPAVLPARKHTPSGTRNAWSGKNKSYSARSKGAWQ